MKISVIFLFKNIEVYLFVVSLLYINNRIIAPNIENIQLLKLQKLSGFANPTADAITPPNILPTIPIIIVINQPAGSAPGLNILAIAPAINPNIIHPNQLIVKYF